MRAPSIGFLRHRMPIVLLLAVAVSGLLALLFFGCGDGPPGSCSLILLTPNGSEGYTAGDTVAIRWTSTSACGAYVDIELLADAETCCTLAHATGSESGPDWVAQNVFAWVAASCTGDSMTEYVIRVTDLENEVSDESNGPFTIFPVSPQHQIDVLSPEMWACQTLWDTSLVF